MPCTYLPLTQELKAGTFRAEHHQHPSTIYKANPIPTSYIAIGHASMAFINI